MQMPDAAIVGKFLQETLVPQKTPASFAKFLRTPFSQNNSGRQLLKCRHCKNEARGIDCLFCKEVDAMLNASSEISARGKHLAIQILWASTRLLVTRVSLIYLLD